MRPGDPLICASRVWRWTALVAHFDGSCHRADAAGGAGVIVRKFAGDDYEVLAQTAYPLPDCPDSYHAEGFASAYAVQALASLYPNHSDAQECLIIGDNSSILSYWRRTAQVRRPALVTVLRQAQLIAATELPRISWRYVPREANKEADFLAGIASAAARNKATLPISLPAPAGEEWQSTAAIALSERSSFCLVECPTFHAQDLAHIRAHHPAYRAALEAYFASGKACVGSNAQGVTVLKQVPYRIDGDDCLGRAYPIVKGAAALPRFVRAALFHSNHVEIDMCGAHYAIFQHMVAQQGLVLPRLDEFRAYLHADLSASPAGRSALHFVKLLPTVLPNSSVEHATQMLQQNRFNPGPELVALLRRVANAKPAFLRACTDTNLLRSHVGLHDGNRIYFLLEGIEAAFMRTLVRELLRRVKPGSLVFIHDGLLISPEPSTVDLEACLASLGLHLVPPPHFQVKIAKLQHDPHPPPGPLPRRAEVQALVTTPH